MAKAAQGQVANTKARCLVRLIGQAGSVSLEEAGALELSLLMPLPVAASLKKNRSVYACFARAASFSWQKVRQYLAPSVAV
eukprot:6306671-Amphidinium_carterae.1